MTGKEEQGWALLKAFTETVKQYEDNVTALFDCFFSDLP